MYCIANSDYSQFEEDKANSLIINKLIELNKSSAPIVLILGGGEPLLFPRRCIEYLNVFKEENTIFHVLTNLSLRMNKDHEELISILEGTTLSQIQTSLDSMNEHTHNILRQGTNLDYILKNIYEINKKNVKLKINTTISEHNYNEVTEVVKYAYNEGIESIHINHVLPGGRAKGKLNNRICHEIIESMMSILGSKEFNGIKEHTMTFPNEIIPFSFIGSQWEDIAKTYGTERSNKYLSSNFVCYLSHDSNLISSGWSGENKYNLNNTTIRDFFNFQNNLQHNDYSMMCKTCIAYIECNKDSFYTGQCELINLSKKIKELLEYEVNLTELEMKRIKLLNFLEKSKHKITSVGISITNKCNGNCNFCQVNGSSDNPKNLFQVDDVVNFLTDSTYMIQITGGEPLLNKNKLLSLIKELKKDGHIISILTNLVLIDDYFLDELVKYFTSLDIIQVSIYAHTSELHNDISGRNDWEILNCKIEKTLSKNIELIANLTLTNENILYVEEIFKFYRKLGVKQICINGLMRKGFAKDMVNYKYIYNYINSIHKFIKNNNLDGVSLSMPIEVIKTYSNINKGLGKVEEKPNPIKQEIQNSLLINCDGNIYSEFTGNLLGNVCTHKILDVIEEDVIRDLSVSECMNCNGYSYCGSAGNLKTISKALGSINYSYCDFINL